MLTPLIIASNARPAETISRDPRHPPLQLIAQRALHPWVQPNYQSYYPLSTAAGYRQNIAFRPAIGQPAGLNNEVVESRIGFALLLLLLGELIDDRFDSSTAAQQSNSNPPVVNSPAIPVWPQLNRPRM